MDTQTGIPDRMPYFMVLMTERFKVNTRTRLATPPSQIHWQSAIEPFTAEVGICAISCVGDSTEKSAIAAHDLNTISRCRIVVMEVTAETEATGYCFVFQTCRCSRRIKNLFHDSTHYRSWADVSK